MTQRVPGNEGWRKYYFELVANCDQLISCVPTLPVKGGFSRA
ncbi:MAG: hypothetical protein NTU73_02760 [Ignavibacteriae bacterium]|nr:hypothetical protein [Ignavibacteriota bacterium]